MLLSPSPSRLGFNILWKINYIIILGKFAENHWRFSSRCLEIFLLWQRISIPVTDTEIGFLRQLWSKRNKTNSTLTFILKQNIWINQIWLKTYLRPQLDLIIPRTSKQTVVISKQRAALPRSSYQLDTDIHGKLIFQNTQAGAMLEEEWTNTYSGHQYIYLFTGL